MLNKDNKQSYMSLPQALYSIIEPYNNEGNVVLLNEELVSTLQLDKTYLESKQGINYLLGNNKPLFSQAYAGHQYGHFTNLGDGRAVMIDEVEPEDKLYDIQLKGSGRTPYSRNGDGKATLYSMLREYLISEAMHYLGVPTTRSLAVLQTNSFVQRDKIEAGGILARVASSHIRVGTIQYAKAINDKETLKALVDYAINRHYPHLQGEDKYQLFLRHVIKNQAKLIAKWQSIGFVHGVMNTDNMTISGETIDYGPCAFLDTFNPKKSFSSIDRNNRYAYQNQPFIGSWNLARFAESIVELLHPNINDAVDIANTELERYQDYYNEEYYKLFGKKLGIVDPVSEERVLVDEILLIMEKYQADFTNTFRLLTLDNYQELPFFNTEDFTLWFQKWTRQLGSRNLTPKERITLMENSNPYIIPRNLVVEETLKKASLEADFTLYNELLHLLKDPYNYKKNYTDRFIYPQDSNTGYVTYCGT